jgi:hypothetical protein
MGRARKRLLFPVALSIDGAADALKIARRRIAEAIYETGELKAYQGPGRSVRVLVADLTDWVRTWPLTELRKRVKP